MEEPNKRRLYSWEISDEFWAKVEPLVPCKKRDRHRKYVRDTGGGRKPIPPRIVLAGIVYVLRTGIQWKALPKAQFGSPSAIHRYFLEWQKAGFFERMWKVGLAEYDEMEGIAWQWQSIDGGMNKAPLALEDVGRNPTDREKNGSKRSILVDGRGIPLSLVVSGAQKHDVKLLPDTLDNVVVKRPKTRVRRRQHLCADKGYTGEPAMEQCIDRNYIPYIRQRGEEIEAKRRNPRFKARRWVVERCLAWLNRFRKLLVRFEKYSHSHTGLLQLACAIICFRQTTFIYG